MPIDLIEIHMTNLRRLADSNDKSGWIEYMHVHLRKLMSPDDFRNFLDHPKYRAEMIRMIRMILETS